MLTAAVAILHLTRLETLGSPNAAHGCTPTNVLTRLAWFAHAVFAPSRLALARSMPRAAPPSDCLNQTPHGFVARTCLLFAPSG